MFNTIKAIASRVECAPLFNNLRGSQDQLYELLGTQAAMANDYLEEMRENQDDENSPEAKIMQTLADTHKAVQEAIKAYPSW